MQDKTGQARLAEAQRSFPWIGSILPWSAALRDKAYANAHSYEGIVVDIPRHHQVTVVGQERGWLRVELSLGGRHYKGYVSQELVTYVGPKLSAPPGKVAEFRALLAQKNWSGAAKVLAGCTDADILALLKQLGAPELAHLKQGALRVPPPHQLLLRVIRPIDSLKPFAGVVGDRLAKASSQVEAVRARFQAGVNPRAKWGARAPRKERGWDEYPKDAPLPLTRLVVHHTAEPLSQTVKQLQDMEMDKPKDPYADLPYHFVITSDGTVHEGRELNVVGGHAGYIEGNKDIKKDPDYGSIGIVVTGDFESRWQNGWRPDTPTPRQLDSLQRLINHLVQRFSIAPENILKHRDVSRGGNVTVCPGGNLSPHVDASRERVRQALKELAAVEAALAAVEKEAAKLK